MFPSINNHNSEETFCTTPSVCVKSLFIRHHKFQFRNKPRLSQFSSHTHLQYSSLNIQYRLHLGSDCTYHLSFPSIYRATSNKHDPVVDLNVSPPLTNQWVLR